MEGKILSTFALQIMKHFNLIKTAVLCSMLNHLYK